MTYMKLKQYNILYHQFFFVWLVYSIYLNNIVQKFHVLYRLRSLFNMTEL